jgi:hypothetical protein
MFQVPREHDGRVTTSQNHDPVYRKTGDSIFSNQLGVKIAMDHVSNADYYAWLDEMIATAGSVVPGAEIVEKPDARVAPSLHTAIYYDTADFGILPTGALLRVTCNSFTRAYCTFKAPADSHQIRRDQRYVFEGHDKAVIQQSPDSPEATALVKRLLSRTDIEQPGTQLRTRFGVDPEALDPAIRLDDHRYTFFVWLDGKDALRCSIDRFEAGNLRQSEDQREHASLAEVELSIYPRIDPEMAGDPRVQEAIDKLAASLCKRFGTSVVSLIKYQRAARALHMGSPLDQLVPSTAMRC